MPDCPRSERYREGYDAALDDVGKIIDEQLRLEQQGTSQGSVFAQSLLTLIKIKVFRLR